MAGKRAKFSVVVAFAMLLASASSLGMPVVRIARAAPPASMGFGPNLVTPSGDGTNEPQITVDQSGRSYLTWQGDAAPFPGSRTTWTTDGTSFNNLQYPDPTAGMTLLGGDVVLATTNWPSLTDTPPLNNTGSNGVFWSDLATPPVGSTCAGDPQVRADTSVDQGVTWGNPNNAGCNPSAVDRQWLDSYTPPSLRGTATAKANTKLFMTYHDVGSSAIWLVRSFDGGASWQQTPFPVVGANAALSACNSIPGGLAVDKSTLHPGRVYLTWETSDPPANPGTGCNITQAQPFDHIFMAYSDDAQTCVGVPPNACAPPTFTNVNVFDDPCFPPGYPASQTCQDVSEFFSPVAVDDAGTPFVAYVRYNLSDPNPEYDTYLAKGTFSGSTLSFTGLNTHKANPGGSGTHYQAALVAGKADAVEVAYYATSYVAKPAMLNKPGAAPNTALWYVYLSQSFDGGVSFTQNQVSSQSNYYGDVCNTGIFCGFGSSFGWGDDRILFEDFGLAIGPDGGARLDWTDSRLATSCVPGTSLTSCQGGKTRIFFACQVSGLGLHGEIMSGCGQSRGVPIPEVPLTGALVLVGVLSAGIALRVTRRERRGGAH